MFTAAETVTPEVSCVSEALPSYQIFKLHIQVLADGELRVWYGFVKVRVEIVEHLANRIESAAAGDG